MQEIDAATLTAPAAEATVAPKSSRRRALVAGGALVATGVGLAAMFFPLMFNQWESYDDEGMFVVSLRLVIEHRPLYTNIWADKYGPFYYFVMSSVYRLIHLQPTLANGRWIVLIVTTASAALFGAAVWRVTKSIPCSLLCEVAAFLILIVGAGKEPMHPGSLGVLLVAIVAFELSSYAMSRTNVHLFIVGVAAGALLMTKLNAGLLILIAVAAAFLVGNANIPRWIRIAVAALAALAPFALVFQNLSSVKVSELAFVVAATVIGVSVVMSIDMLPLPRWSLVSVALGTAAAAVGSCLFPLFTGTPLSSVLTGVFIRPLDQASQLSIDPNVRISWLAFLITFAGIGAAASWSRWRESVRGWSPWFNAALAAVGLWLLGVGATLVARGYPAAEWLPALALVPAIACCSYAPEPARFALRSFVLLAAFQVMVAYPVAGTQLLWGTVVMTVPCAIAIAVGIDHLDIWRDATRETRLVATVLMCSVLLVASAQWPVTIWSDYLHSKSFNLPGTALIRIDPDQRHVIRSVAQELRKDCDTFYGVPDENSFYVFTRFQPFTGQLVDRPLALSDEQQAQVVRTLRLKSAANRRVCILRDLTQGYDFIPPPLRKELDGYSDVIATIGSYTISKHK